MKRRQFLGTVAAFGAAAATGACGIPGDSEPRFLESGRPVEPQRGTPAEPPGPAIASSAADLVTNYFKAAAGANDGQPETLAKAQDRARAYLLPSVQAGWQPNKQQLFVVRAAVGTTSQAGAGAVDVNVALAVVGVLNSQGTIDPAPNVQLQPTKLTVAPYGSSEYRLQTAPPPYLLLSDEGLKDFYTSQVIYFWDASNPPMLVPDQRYLPKSIGGGKQPAEIVGWLSAGAPQWLAPALGPQPLALDGGIEVKDVTLTEQQRLIVNLSSKAANVDQHRLAVQLRWSTGAIGGVDLRIEGVSTGASSDDYTNYNASVARPDNNVEPERFCVDNRKARPVEANNLTQVLDHDFNADVLLAAIPVRKRAAALVRQDPKGQRLWLGTLSGAGDTKTPVYWRTDVTAQSMSRPVWISRPSTQVLVLADGTIRSVALPAPGHTGDIQSAEVGLPADIPRPVTALSVSPDGRRIALIAAGKVIVAPLKLEDTLAVGGQPYRTIRTDLVEQLTVAWSAETKLLVGGTPIKDSKHGLFEITIDGAGQESVPREGTDNYRIDRVSVRPANPMDSRRLAMLDANGTAFIVFANDIRQLQLTGPSPQPSPSSAPPETHPTAPFFLD